VNVESRGMAFSTNLENFLHSWYRRTIFQEVYTITVTAQANEVDQAIGRAVRLRSIEVEIPTAPYAANEVYHRKLE